MRRSCISLEQNKKELELTLIDILIDNNCLFLKYPLIFIYFVARNERIFVNHNPR